MDSQDEIETIYNFNDTDEHGNKKATKIIIYKDGSSVKIEIPSKLDNITAKGKISMKF